MKGINFPSANFQTDPEVPACQSGTRSERKKVITQEEKSDDTDRDDEARVRVLVHEYDPEDDREYQEEEFN